MTKKCFYKKIYEILKKCLQFSRKYDIMLYGDVDYDVNGIAAERIDEIAEVT